MSSSKKSQFNKNLKQQLLAAKGLPEVSRSSCLTTMHAKARPATPAGREMEDDVQHPSRHCSSQTEIKHGKLQLQLNNAGSFSKLF